MATTPKTAKPAAAKAPAAKKAPAVKKPKAPVDPNAPKKVDALQKPLQPSPELAEIVGKDVLPRGQVVSKVWEYIRKHNLQNPADKREILADAKLKKVFGRDKCTMFEMNKYLAQHLK
jgi:upstream activation factor subunit UAF30